MIREINVEPYSDYMNNNCTVEFHDCPINNFSLEEIARFSEGGNGDVFTKSFDVTVKGLSEFKDPSIISAVARYESENGEIPAVQIRIIDGTGHSIYFSPVYEIGHKREFYRREWRIMPTIDRYDTVRVSFIIPEGVRLFIRDFRLKRNYGYREKDIGIRYHGHGGLTSVLGWQLVAEMGFTSAIAVPKFTKDGVGVCIHDTNVIKELRLDDCSMPEEGGKYDKPVCELTYDELLELNVWNRKSDIFTGMRVPTLEEFFRICSHTGMQPIFSVHPALTKEQWIYVRKLLIKYRLLEHFWIKAGDVERFKPALEVFDNEIAGYIMIFGAKSTLKPTELEAEVGFDRKRHKLVVEYFGHVVTRNQILDARKEGYHVSIAAMRGGVSGPRMEEMIELGVSEFTVDHHCSMGLSW